MQACIYFNKSDENSKNQFVTDLLLESNKSDFNKILNDNIKLFHLHLKQLLSFYIERKYHCNVEYSILELDKSSLFLLPKNNCNKAQKPNNPDYYISKKSKIKTMCIGKITSGFSKIYKLLLEKIIKHFASGNQKNLLCFDSFDDVNHL